MIAQAGLGQDHLGGGEILTGDLRDQLLGRAAAHHEVHALALLHARPGPRVGGDHVPARQGTCPGTRRPDHQTLCLEALLSCGLRLAHHVRDSERAAPEVPE